MNIPSPQEQFENRKRLDALFRSHLEPLPKARRRPVIFVEDPYAPRCPWPKPKGYRVTSKGIISLVAHRYNVRPAEIVGQGRSQNVVKPRQIVCHLLKEIRGMSLPEIGRKLGGRDHTTALHSLRAVRERIGKDEAFAAEIQELKHLLMAGEHG